MDGAGLAAALALGAQAVQMGTAFLACPERGAHPQHKLALRTQASMGTAITTAFSGRPPRAIRNRFVQITEAEPARVLRFPVQNRLTAPLRAESAKRGTPEFMSLFAGQAFTMAREEAAGARWARSVREAHDTLIALARGSEPARVESAVE